MTKNHYYLILLLLLSYKFSFGQLSHAQTIEGIEILGMSKLDDGVIIFSTGEQSKSITCRKINSDGTNAWSTLIKIPDLGGYNFNMLQVFYDSQAVYITQQLEEYTIVSKYNKETGDEVYDNDQLRTPASEEPHVWVANEGNIYYAHAKDGLVSMQKNEDGSLGDEEDVSAFPDQYTKNQCQALFSKPSLVYSSAYVLEPNHGTMHLALSKYNLATKESVVVEHELELEHSSFTYNSQFDLRVMGCSKGNSGFYLIGKLDYHFDKPYPTTKMGDNHVGIWIAKFDFDLNLVYLSELPYQYFIGLVPANTVQKPAVIDIKEDANKGLFINVNEMQGIIYGNKYLVYIDSTGLYRSAIGGKDDYNILEYDKMGLRDAGRKYRIRLMNGHWSAYATNTFLFTNNRPQDHSVQAEKLITLVKNNNRMDPQTWSYNFIIYEENALYFEHSDRKGGTLNIYTDTVQYLGKKP